jgi:uncharacterized repeat protein (TIGR03803 family)
MMRPLLTRFAGGLVAAMLAACPAAKATTFTTLHAFPETSGDGMEPLAGLTFDPTTGLLYGTTAAFGGTVFELNPITGSETILHSFTGGTDGNFPSVSVTLDPTTRALYGTTQCNGVVFKLDIKTKALTILHAFTPGNCLFSGSDLLLNRGAIYGTEEFGGTGGLAGIVYKLSLKPVKLSTLYDFGAHDQGALPQGGLVSDNSGRLYGTTSIAPSGTENTGTVFRLDAATKALTRLHDFTGGNDGGSPVGDLIFVQGKLYGTTSAGGSIGFGTVFGLDPGTRKLTTLHTFHGGSDGANPAAGLAYRNGALYGTTQMGGLHQFGTVFKIDLATRRLTPLHQFTGGDDGGTPLCRLVFDTKGAVYGTTSVGGANGQGTVFKIGP